MDATWLSLVRMLLIPNAQSTQYTSSGSYYTNYSEKDHWLKYLGMHTLAGRLCHDPQPGSVFAVTITGGLHVGLGTGAQYGVLVEGWGLPEVWQSTPWEASMLPFTTGLSE